MTKRHKHLIFYRMLLVIGIPTVYFACISFTGFITNKSSEIDYPINGRNEIRKLQTLILDIYLFKKYK